MRRKEREALELAAKLLDQHWRTGSAPAAAVGRALRLLRAVLVEGDPGRAIQADREVWGDPRPAAAEGTELAR